MVRKFVEQQVPRRVRLVDLAAAASAVRMDHRHQPPGGGEDFLAPGGRGYSDKLAGAEYCLSARRELPFPWPLAGDELPRQHADRGEYQNPHHRYAASFLA